MRSIISAAAHICRRVLGNQRAFGRAVVRTASKPSRRIVLDYAALEARIVRTAAPPCRTIGNDTILKRTVIRTTTRATLNHAIQERETTQNSVRRRAKRCATIGKAADYERRPCTGNTLDGYRLVSYIDGAIGSCRYDDGLPIGRLVNSVLNRPEWRCLAQPIIAIKPMSGIDIPIANRHLFINRRKFNIICDCGKITIPAREFPAVCRRHLRCDRRAAVRHRLHQFPAARARTMRTEIERDFMDVNFKLDAYGTRTIHNDHERIGRLENRKTRNRLFFSVLKIIDHEIAGPFDEMMMRIRYSRQIELEICFHPSRPSARNRTVGRRRELKPVVCLGNIPGKGNRVRRRYHDFVRDYGRRIRSAAPDDLRAAQVVHRRLRRDEAQLRTIFHVCHGDVAVGIRHRYVVTYATIQRIDRNVTRHIRECSVPTVKQPAVFRTHRRSDRRKADPHGLRQRSAARTHAVLSKVERDLMRVKKTCHVHSERREERLPVVGKGAHDGNASICRDRHAVCQNTCFFRPVIRFTVSDESRNIAVEVHLQIGTRNLRNTAGGVILHNTRERGKTHGMHRCRDVNGIALPQAASTECMRSDVHQPVT